MKESDHLEAERSEDSRFLCFRGDGFSAEFVTLAAGLGDASVFGFTITGKTLC